MRKNVIKEVNKSVGDSQKRRKDARGWLLWR